jgi:integrase
VQPPSSGEVRTILANVSERWRLPIRILCATGLRVGELAHVTWGDVDIADSQFRIAEIGPQLGQQPTAAVFAEMTEAGCRVAMWRACQRAGIANYSPHDLRDRWISVQLKRGVPITEVTAASGHSRSSMTLDTYAHVVTDTDDI